MISRSACTASMFLICSACHDTDAYPKGREEVKHGR